MIVMQEKQLFTDWQCAAYAVMYAIGACSIMRLVFVADTVPANAYSWVYLAAVTLLGAIPIGVVYKRLVGWQILSFGLIYTIAFIGIDGYCGYRYDLYKERTGESLPLFTLLGARPVFGDTSALIISLAIGNVISVALCFLKHGRVIMQDGTLCPKCSYCILGAVDQRCSECGRPFRYEELGTTKEQLDKLRGPPMARKI